MESLTKVRYSPGSFMTGKFVRAMQNTIRPNWHSFKFFYWGISRVVKCRAFLAVLWLISDRKNIVIGSL